jgi:SNF2 family DNA or RNA helicase
MPEQEKIKRVPYYKKPGELTVEEWQAALRKQYAQEQRFEVKNIGSDSLYSDYEVYNPETDKKYKVSIRDNISSYNFCSCPDFRVNTLGTCKHVEFVLLSKLRFKKYQKLITQAQKNTYTSLSIFYGRDQLVRLKKADHIEKYPREEEYFDHDGFVLPGMVPELDLFIREASASDPAFRIYPDVFEFISRHKEAKSRREKLREIFPEGIESRIFDDLVRTTLYPYQKEGVMGILKAGRVLLADDMGLGKTIQAIAAVEIFARFFGVSRVLIICPTSLKYQWKNEILKFTGKEACIVEGLIHKRKTFYRQDDFYKIISYGVVRSDMHLIDKWKAGLVIVDEAQRIKNWKTQIARSVKKIRSEYAIVTTGTPLENRIDELHSIVEFLDMYKLGPLFRFLHNHQVEDETGKITGYRNLRTIHKTLDDVLIRRTKKEIRDQLPGRIDKNFFVEMTEEQSTEHKDYYNTVAKLASKWIQLGYLEEEERQILMTSLNCMRMVANSTYILDSTSNHGNKVPEVKNFISELMEEKGNKLLIFSQWKRMFELLIRELKKMDVQFVYLNGDVPAIQRKTIIDQFQQDKDLRIFLSTDAGGVGVNLQKANILINLDLPWNPAVLEQRIGRIYRLGQKKKIQVFNFISAYSIEHRILHLLEFKKTLFKGVLDEHGKDQVMMEGFLQSVNNLLDVDLEQKERYLPKYTQDWEKPKLAAEVNGEYLHKERHHSEEIEIHDKALAEIRTSDTGDIVPQQTGSTGNSGLDTGKGFRGLIRRWLKSVSKLFDYR